MPPLRLDDVDRVELAADLTAAGHPTAWARLAPHDLDPTAFATLAGAMIATAPAGTPSTEDGVPTVVVESDDDSQVGAFLDQVGTAWPHPRRPIPIILRSAAQPPADEADPSSLPSLRRRVADLTSGLSPQTRSLLTVVTLFGYCHERFASMEPVLTECAALPWWVALHGDWWQIPGQWRPAVTTAAGFGRPVELRVLARMVCELVEDGAGDEAIELCLDAGFPGLASDMLAEAAPVLLRAERFRALHRWLHRMPPEVQSRHGELVTQLAAVVRPELGPLPRRWWRRRRGEVPHRTTAGEPVPPEPVAAPCPVLPTAAVAGPSPQPPGSSAPCPPTHPLVYSPTHPLVLVARLFGPLDVAIGGHRIERWRSRKGRSLLAHLLLRRGHPLDRETLEEAQWPDVAPEVARNRLHVTLHGLRRDLRTASALPIVVFDQGYGLNPELDLRVDTETFEAALTSARRAQGAGDRETALTRFQEAVDAYQGDLLSDEPGDDWILLRREQLRVAVLDAWGACARLSFELGDYDRCIGSSQELLRLDFCREDLHRLLIRAYARLGQPHLALRQFELCAQQLRAELEMEPGHETVALLERVKAQLPV
jgi:DNA-binding SARP family transcriptional activator